MIIRVVDLETNGGSSGGEIIEVGVVDVSVGDKGPEVGMPRSRLFQPRRPFDPETCAIHHITAETIPPNAGYCSDEALHQALSAPVAADLYAAHYCAFERSFINDRVAGDATWICTYKTALRLWPEAPRHSNQVLRYWRGLQLNSELAMPPHRAAPDAYVTAHLLVQMLAVATMEDLVRWSEEPDWRPTPDFGKHKGRPWGDIPADYLEWLTRQPDLRSGAGFWAERELSRRQSLGPENKPSVMWPSPAPSAL